MLKMGSQGAILGSKSITIFSFFYLPTANRHHGFNTDHHSRFQLNSLVSLSIVWHLRIFMDLFSNAVPTQITHHAISLIFQKPLNRVPQVSRGNSSSGFFNTEA